MRHFLANLLQLILSPGNGWEDIARAGLPPEREFHRAYIPLCIAAAASSLLALVYHHGISTLHQAMTMVIVFMMFFLGNFIGNFTLSIFLPQCSRSQAMTRRGQTFVLYTLGLLAANQLLVNCLPMTAVLLFFMPIYVAIIMWKGTLYLNIDPRRVGTFMLAAILGILLPPYLIYFIFSLILP